MQNDDPSTSIDEKTVESKIINEVVKITKITVGVHEWFK